MGKLLSKTLLALAITTIAATAFSADNSLGTWKLNIEKSKYTLRVFPVKSMTTVRQAAEGGVKVTTTGELTNGAPINVSYTAKYDGKEYPVRGSGAPYDTISIRQVNADTFIDQRKKTGTPFHATGNTVISNGGKTMTWTSKGTDADGKTFPCTLIYEKQ